MFRQWLALFSGSCRSPRWLCLGLCLMGGVSCRHSAELPATSVELPERFSRSGTEVIPDQWWEAFGDESLNAMVSEALAGNLDLQAAWQRLRQAEFTAVKSGAERWLRVDGSAGLSRDIVRRYDGAGRRYATEHMLGLAVSYEVDLWGRVEASRDAALLDALASGQNLRAAGITVAAEFARVWFRLVEAQSRLRLVDEQIQTSEQYLELITRRFRSGQAAASDVLQQRQIIEARRGDRARILSELAVLGNSLDILRGVYPGSAAQAAGVVLPELPPLPATGVPAALVQRRPDVLAAEFRLLSSDRGVAVAVSDRFPRLQLSLTGQSSGADIGRFLDNWLASIAGSLTAPLFDGGRRRAEVGRTEAVFGELTAAYRQVVLGAMQEVEDALAQERHQLDFLASIERQLQLSTQALESILDRYMKGTMEFTRYLTALLEHQELQVRHLAAQRDLLLVRLGLYRALAGGWSLPSDEVADE